MIKVTTILVFFSSTFAQAGQTTDVDTSNWACDFCTYPQGWFGTLGIGPGFSNYDSAKFADYRGITQEGMYVLIDGDAHYLDHRDRYFDLYTRDLGIDSRQIEMRAGRRGRVEFRLAYREIPKYRGYGTRTPFQGPAGNQLTLPDNWVRAANTGGMSALGASLGPAPLETKRKIFEAGLSLKMSGNWRYELNFNHTEKEGTRAFGAGVFTLQSSHFPAPVDFSTNRVEMGLEYSNKRTRLRLGFHTASFSNQYSTIGWQNPFQPVGNTGNLRAALEPDSFLYQFSLAGSARLSPSVQISGNASLGRTSQDVDYTTYSINPDYDDLELPRSSLRGEMDRLNLGAKLRARLSQGLSLFLDFKYDDRNNRTPVNSYTPVITDLVLRPGTPNRPYSFERTQASAQFSYLTNSSLSFNAGAKEKDYQRTLQSVRTTQDRGWWGEASIDPWSTVQFRVKFESSARDISPYRTVNDPGLQENVLMRKFYLADRDRDRMTVELDISPGQLFSAGLSYFVSRDTYEESILGLMQSEEHSASLDLALSVKEDLGLHAFVMIEDYESDISSAEYGSASGWMAKTDDHFLTWGFGLNGQLTDKLEFSVDFVSAGSRGRIMTDSDAGDLPFPELKTELRSANVRLNYRVSKQWTISLQAEHEKYHSTDWQVDGLGNDGIKAILTLGPESPDYKATVIGLRAVYHF